MANGNSFDYIVIGSGATGSVVANRLSADPNARVLVLEAGVPDISPRISDPSGFVQLWGSELDWNLSIEAQPGLQSRQFVINQGKVMGGSTSMNALMWVRGNARNFDAWAAGGADGWSFADVLPYFKKVEDYGGGASVFRGTGGPVPVLDNPDENSRSKAFIQGAQELGYDGNWDYNGERQENGAGWLQFSLTRDGRRASAPVAYLHPIAARDNLRIETGALATRLLIEGSRVVGVEYSQDGELQQARTEREVIVSAGAFLSPKLLMLSGIGPQDQLRALDIPVALDLPGVGQNLQDHLQLPVVYAAKSEHPLPNLLTGNTLFVNTRSSTPDAPPDLQLNFTPAVPSLLVPVLNIPVPVGIFLPIMVQPQSRGEVRLRSANPQDAPVIQPNYLQEAADVQTFVEAVALIRRLAQTAPMAEQYAAEIAPGRDADLDDYIRSQSSTLWHPVGTCQMGRGEAAVVDPQLRVHGLEGIRVADASVMPIIPSGNTQATCFMIGEKVSDLILGT